MTVTLLLDLDSTLLGNDMDRFAPVYMQALSSHLVAHHIIDGGLEKNFPKLLWAATQKMIENTNPRLTLKEAFDVAFYPILGIDQEKAKPVIDQFYAEVFPTLKYVTEYRPDAVSMVKQAVKRGYRLAIATNPLFPRVATLHRLTWAGLPADEYPFEIISSYEDFHFAKPNPAYYAELLARMGWPNDPVVMVGNDTQNDIAPAKTLGLPTYWITDGNSQEHKNNGSHGPIAGFLPWLDAYLHEHLQPDIIQPEGLLAILASTPAAFLTISANISLAAWSRRPQPGEWALNEILCHLRDVDKEVNLPRLQKFIQETNPFIPAADTDPWAEERQYICQDGDQALEAFITTRQQVLELLTSLKSEGWMFSGRHTIFGPTTLAELVSITAGHDRLHIQQFSNTLREVNQVI